MLAMDAEPTRLKPVSGTFRAINGCVRGELSFLVYQQERVEPDYLQRFGALEMRWREPLVSWVTRP